MLAVCIRVAQVWEAVVILGTADCLLIFLALRSDSEVLLATVGAALVISTSVQIAHQWERAVVLRFGSFRGLKPSGVFFILPVVDKVAQFVDQRIRVSDFSAETTLTADTVAGQRRCDRLLDGLGRREVGARGRALLPGRDPVGADGAAQRHRQA